MSDWVNGLNLSQDGFPHPGVRAAFQFDTAITDLEFLSFWESLSLSEMRVYRENAIKMGFLQLSDGVVMRFPETYIGKVVL